MELKTKVVLNKKGDEAFVPLKGLVVALKWNDPVDLDLMAFYKTKDGRVGGVFTDNLPGGNHGDMNAFPYMQLSGDAGVGAQGGANEETLRIAKLDDIAELYIVALNYTAATSKQDVTFSDYDGAVVITDDQGKDVGVPLDSTDKGVAALVCRIDNTSPIGAKLINENKVMSLPQLVETVPGAVALTTGVSASQPTTQPSA